MTSKYGNGDTIVDVAVSMLQTMVMAILGLDIHVSTVQVMIL